MARWPRPREEYEPQRVEVEISSHGVEIERTYEGSDGVTFEDCHTYSRCSRWPAWPVRLGGHHTWFVGGHTEEDIAPDLPDPDYGRGRRLDDDD